MKFKKNDQVKITAGKDKGKTGQITQTFPSNHRVTVKGVNLYKKHLKSRSGVEGGIFSLERPLPTANIALICPTCKQPTRIGYVIPKQGDKRRICKKCSAELSQPKTEKTNQSKKK